MKKYVFILIAMYNMLYGQNNKDSDVLQKSFIYSPGKEGAVVFRKAIVIKDDISKAELNIFADSYYSLYINGKYVINGPSRFDPSRPEYDTKNVNQFLKKGKNQIAVLVYSGISSGMRMKHDAGLTLLLRGKGFNLVTDTSWKCSGKTRFKTPWSLWNGLKETIDASSENGDCLNPGYDDSKWEYAVSVNGSKWGKLHTRILPFLAEREIKSWKKLMYPAISDTFKITFDKNYLVNVEMLLEAEQ